MIGVLLSIVRIPFILLADRVFSAIHGAPVEPNHPAVIAIGVLCALLLLLAGHVLAVWGCLGLRNRRSKSRLWTRRAGWVLLLGGIIVLAEAIRQFIIFDSTGMTNAERVQGTASMVGGIMLRLLMLAIPLGMVLMLGRANAKRVLDVNPGGIETTS